MKITSIQMSLGDTNDSVLAYASVVFDCQLVIHDIKIVKTADGLIVCMPCKPCNSRCTGCNRKISFTYHYCPYCCHKVNVNPDRVRYIDTAHPIDKNFRAYVNRKLIDRYLLKTAEPDQQPSATHQHFPRE